MQQRSRRVTGMILAAVVCVCWAGVDLTRADELAASTIDEAATLMAEGRLIAAKRELVQLNRNEMNEYERERAFDLLTSIERRIRHADPVDLSLQKAELAMEAGNLREADRQAHAARRSERATRPQRDAAEFILKRSEQLKKELAPLVNPALERAIADFNAGDYADAKTGLDSVYRSGVELTPAQLREIDRHRQRVAELERYRGEPFAFESVSLGMFQPGRITRRDDARGQQDDSQIDEPDDVIFEEPIIEDEGFVDINDDFMDDGFQDAELTDPGDAGDQDFQDMLSMEAQRVLAEADAAFGASRYNEAIRKYQEILGPFRGFVSNDDVQRAELRIDESRVMLQQPGAGALKQQTDTRSIIVQQARAEFQDFLIQSREALVAGDFNRSRTLAEQARIRLSDVRGLFSETEFNNLSVQQTALIQEIITAEETSRLNEADERSSKIADEAQEQEQLRRQEKRVQINESLDRVRALQLEQKYEEALQVVDQILFLDPQDPAGLLLRDTLRDVILFREFDRLQREKHYGYARESVNMQNELVIPRNILDYPPDWPELSFRRGEPTAFTESAADRRVLAALEAKRVPATFADNTLEDVLEFVATVTNLNVDIDWESLSDIGVDRDTLVSLNLQALPAKVILDRVLEKVSPDSFSRASWAVNDGVLVVASDADLRKNTFIVIYDVRDLLYQIPDFNNAPELDLDSVLNQGQGGGGSGSIFDEEDEDDERITKQELRERLIEILQTNVDFEGWRDNGGDTGIIQELNDNLIITNTARNHRRISGLLRQLREIRSIQINVEARFLMVTQEFFEQIGFDVDVIFNAQNSQFEDALAQQDIFSPTVDIPSGRTTLLPSNIVNAFFSSAAGNRTGATQEFQDTDPGPGSVPGLVATPFAATAPNRTSMIPVNQNSASIVESLISSPFASNFVGPDGLTPALQLAGTFLDDVQVDFLVEATQADRRSIVLTAPRLTFTNGHTANIFVTSQRSFVSDLNPIVGTNSVAFDPQLSVLSTGFSLQLDGVVSADRRYVTLTIDTALAEEIPNPSPNPTVTAQTGGGTQDGTGSPPVTASFEAPAIQITSISTGATIPDRGTLMIGGQRIVNEAEVESGVPVLSKLPIINRFFTNRIESKEEMTLFILIKPTIIIQNEEEERNFPGLLDSLQNRFDAGF